MEKPEDLDEYKKWLKEVHNIKVTDKTKNYYDLVSTTVKDKFENSQFWIDFIGELHEYNDEFSLLTQYPLLVNDDIKLLTKNWDSFLEKTFRQNIIFNYNWPNPPKGGWILDNNWFERTNDIIRTLIAIKYLDGVDFIIKKIQSLAERHGIEIQKKLEARDDGYYAAHIYIKNEFEIPKIDWDTEKKPFTIEIQITTQLQEVIRKLLHRYYENTRKLPKPDDSWKWDYESNEFSASYLGHILHYIEGLIVQTRERQKL